MQNKRKWNSSWWWNQINRTYKKIKIQVGGGIRSLDHIKKLVDYGVDKVILGTAAVEDVKFLKIACIKFKNKIAISLDVRDGYIALRGWTKQTKILASEFVKKIENVGISRIIYTDINRDGTGTQPNLIETFNFSKLTNIPVIISGGFSSINDVVNVHNHSLRIEGIIIGKAMYNGNILPEQVVSFDMEPHQN